MGRRTSSHLATDPLCLSSAGIRVIFRRPSPHWLSCASLSTTSSISGAAAHISITESLPIRCTKEAPSTLTISNAWKGLTRNERLALFHLAKTGFLVSSHPGLPKLVAQRWVSNKRRLRPANQSIAKFVLSKEDEILELERAVSGGAWDRISWPLGFSIILLLGGLLYTQQDLLRSTAALVGMLTTIVPLTTKVLDLLKGVRSSAPASST